MIGNSIHENESVQLFLRKKFCNTIFIWPFRVVATSIDRTHGTNPTNATFVNRLSWTNLQYNKQPLLNVEMSKKHSWYTSTIFWIIWWMCLQKPFTSLKNSYPAKHSILQQQSLVVNAVIVGLVPGVFLQYTLSNKDVVIAAVIF
jgi:hypothetical protein